MQENYVSTPEDVLCVKGRDLEKVIQSDWENFTNYRYKIFSRTNDSQRDFVVLSLSRHAES